MKTNKKRYKSLKKLGIAKGKAWEWANSGKSYIKAAHTFIMH
ncbi:hypothetical protein J2S15_001194 [Breznakia pachnodae]|uniref:Uncharacterized protein n=1 Tax=Breznakia pachnodae TaxID=265178 RepID=A0ABU0E0Q8_9FIRM|nr:hypothetical protein [Breznakia pachnodae]